MNAGAGPSSATAYELCALRLSADLGRPLTLGALHDALEKRAENSREGQIRAIMRAAEQNGLRVAFGKRALKKLTPGLLPAILLTNDGGAVVLYEQDGNVVRLFDPNEASDQPDETNEQAFKDLEARYSGYALSLTVEHRYTKGERITGTKRHWFRDAMAANRWSFTQVALAALMVNLMSLVTALFIMVVYDRILPSGAIASLFALTVGVAFALAFDVILKTLRAGFIDHAGRRADLSMGEDLFDQLLETEMSARKGSVGAISATMREFETLRDFFTSATMVALVDLPFVIIFVAVIYVLAGPLAVAPAIAIPIVLLIGFAVQPILGRLSDNMLVGSQTKQTVLVETLNGIETIKASGAGRHMRARWADAIRRQASYAVRSRTVTQGAIHATGFIQQSAQILTVVYGAVLVISGAITSGVLIAAVILTGRALAPLALIAQTLTRMYQARSSYHSLNMLMQAPTEHAPEKQFVSRPTLSGGLRFEGVRFSYPEQDQAVLDNVSFDIAAGERVAIMGPVGSGKSTLVRLVLGLYRPTQGAVLADGIDIRQIDPTDLRRNIGTVLQDPWLVSGSLRENIALGAARASDAEILAAAKIAGVEDFAARHPAGYDMQVGERGQELSGGQRQAVALARGLIGNPPILLLDEPSSAMDVQSESALIAQLKKAAPNRTLLVITHRTSLLDLVDRIIVLHSGRVVADGSKDSILNRATPARGQA